jgi:hypothetical protein
MLGEDGHLALVVDPDGEMREEMFRHGIEYINVWNEREVHYITDGQLAWRRWAMDERCQGDPLIFQQEFPSTTDEAFVQSGNPWWDRAGMEAVRKTITPPIAVGTFACPRPDWFKNSSATGVWREDWFHPLEMKQRRAEVQWVASDIGDWWIWRLPEPGEEYLVAIDTAEGGETGNGAAIQVFHRRTLEQVAEFSGFMDTDLLSHQTAMVCYFYNMAWAIPEVNNTGYGFMVTFERLWKRIYFRVNPDAPFGTKQSWVTGFKTTAITRPILVTRGQNYIREKVVTIHSSRLYMQLLTFVKDSKGIPRASGKNMDDLVMAFLFALELAELRPVKLDKATRPVTLWDDKMFQAHVARMRGRRHDPDRRRAVV